MLLGPGSPRPRIMSSWLGAGPLDEVERGFNFGGGPGGGLGRVFMRDDVTEV